MKMCCLTLVLNLVRLMQNKINEIMAITQEECAEVVQAISKVNRFGLDAIHNGRSNRDHLEEEVGDLMCMLDLLIEVGVLDLISVAEAGNRKRKKLMQWSNIFKDEEDAEQRKAQTQDPTPA